MATSTFRDLPDKEDKTLFLVMDGDNNLTGDPKTIDRMLERRETTELRIIRLLASSADSGDHDELDDRPRVKLTVEEILPENEEEEGKIGDSTVPPDFVDPLSQLDTEAMLRLKKALASDQAKQILGDNVTAMLDVLSVDDNPTMFLQNSIRRDHCYTPLSPSADPKGASFVPQPQAIEGGVKRSKGRPPKVDGVLGKASGSGLCQNKNPQIATSTASDAEPTEDMGEEEYDQSSEESESDRSSDSDYRDRNSVFGARTRKRGAHGSRRIRGGFRGRGFPRGRGRPRKERRPSEGEPGEEAESPESQVTPPTSTTAPQVVHVPGKRGRPRKEPLSPSTTHRTNLSVASSSTSIAAEPAVPVDIDHAAAKVYSADAIRLGRPTGKSEEERRRDMARILSSLDPGGRGRKVIYIQRGNRPPQLKVNPETSNSKEDKQLTEVLTSFKGDLKQEPTIAVGKTDSTPVGTYVRREGGSKEAKAEAVAEEPAKVSALSPPPPPPKENIMGGKYPRRENRKLPSHLADTVGPALLPVTDSHRKKNPGTGVDEAGKAKAGGKVVQHSLLRYVRKTPLNSTPAAWDTSLEVEPAKDENVVDETTPIPVVDDLASAVDELQTMLEEGLAATTTPNPDSGKSPSITDNPGITQSKNRKLPEEGTSEKQLSEHRKSSGKRGSDIDPKKVSETQAEEIHMEKVGGSIRMTSEKIIRASRSSKDENPTYSVDRDTSISLSEENNSNIAGASRSSKSPKGRKTSLVDAPEQESSLLQEATSDVVQVEEESTLAADERRRAAIKRRRSDEVSDLDSDIDDTLSEASWNSEDDPERLWCICRKPHNNRFMICCDVCEDWFHGKCVGITKSIGKQMEQDGLEWSCPPCTKKKRAEENEKDGKPVVKLTAKGTEIKQTIQTKLSGFSIKQTSAEDSSTRKCIMCKGPVRENSIYCSDQCIRRHSQRAIAQLSSANKAGSDRLTSSAEPAPAKREERHVIVMDPTSKKVLTGASAPTVSNLATWLTQNPSFHVLFQKKLTKPVAPGTSVIKAPGDSVKKIHLQPAQGSRLGSDLKPTQLKLTVSPNSKHIKIISRAPGQPVIKVISSGIAKRSLVTTAEASPVPKPRLLNPPKTIDVKQVESPKSTKAPERKPVESPKPLQRRRKEKLQVLQDYKPPPTTSSRTEESKEREKGGGGTGEQAIRDSVRKMLGESLKARVADAKDLDVKEKDIDALALKIEDRLFKHFENKVDVKYKSKYRSLVFNIKDQKNETLFRKIVENSISPKQLVRLTPDEMASQELAQWREKENQHQLEIIKKTELELMTLGQTFILKSHKGEEVIEKDQKVATAAAEIDPNTSAQELVSALNSVSSTTPDTGDASNRERDAETSLMKMKKKEKERRREKEKKRKRSRSRGRGSKHSKSRKRSRSRSRDRHRRDRDRKASKSHSSRHSRDSRDTEREKDDKKEKEKLEEELVEISTSEDVERKQNEPMLSDEADYEPTSTVTIKTPETFPEEQEDMDDYVEPEEVKSVWSGQIVMAEVAKFQGRALAAAGLCANVHSDVGGKISVVGRIPYETVWEYMARMKKMATKDILVLQIVPMDTDQDRSSFSTLYSYLSKRSRIGVIGRISDQVKDFYLYPHSGDTPLPAVLQPLTIPLPHERGHILLGIIVRTKRGTRPIAPSAQKLSSPLPKPVTAPPKAASLPLPPTSPVAPTPRSQLLPLPASPTDVNVTRSYTPPLPDLEGKTDPRKRKIRVHVELAKKPSEDDDGDAPYSPASSDEDLPPLSKIPKQRKTTPLVKPIPSIPQAEAEALAEAAQIQKKIEEMNRAIEEQTQQIQTLASTVPLLPVVAPVLAAVIPLASEAASATSISIPQMDLALQALQSITPTPVAPPNSQFDSAAPPILHNLVASADTKVPSTAELDIPLPPSPPTSSKQPTSWTDDAGDIEPYSPSGSLSPEPTEAMIAPPALLLPEVAQISIPSNLQEILASIKQAKPPVAQSASAPNSPPPVSPSPLSPVSPEPLPPGMEIGEIEQPPAPKTLKRKQDRSNVFDREGVPEFMSGKSKQIKFDLKLKSRDTDDRVNPATEYVAGQDERQTVVSGLAQDDRVVRKHAFVKDHDDRSINRSISADIVVIEEQEPDRDQAGRVLRLSPNTDEPIVISTVRRDRSRTRSPSSDKDERLKRRRSDSHRHRSERHQDPERKELEAEWEGSIRQFEDDLRRRNHDIRQKEIERLRRRSESDTD